VLQAIAHAAGQTWRPGGSTTELAGLLTTLDEFLRSSPQAAAVLAAFLASNGHPDPRYAGSLFIDEVSFTALRLRQLTGHAGASPGRAGVAGDPEQHG
jgi:hypothetical protein